MVMCFESEGITLLQLRKFLYHIYNLSQLFYVFHHIALPLFQVISCSIQIHLWLLLQVMYYIVTLCNSAWATKKNEGFASCG